MELAGTSGFGTDGVTVDKPFLDDGQQGEVCSLGWTPYEFNEKKIMHWTHLVLRPEITTCFAIVSEKLGNYYDYVKILARKVPACTTDHYPNDLSDEDVCFLVGTNRMVK
jgi:hypothetical protein